MLWLKGYADGPCIRLERVAFKDGSYQVVISVHGGKECSGTFFMVQYN